MASEVVCGLIFRVLLPVCLAAACLFRYNGLSFIYLLFLLLIPLFPEPSNITMQGYTGHLLKSLCFCSMTFLFIHIVYQITIHSLLAANSIDSEFNCSVWEKSIRQIGFESVIGADAGNGIRVFLPDIGMFMASLSVWLLCRKLVHKRPSEEMAQDNHDFEPEEKEENDEKVEDDDDDDEMLYDEDFDAEDEAEEEDGEGGGLEEEEEEEEVQESTKMKILRRVAGVANKFKEIIGNLITTAGQVVVTILLGLTGVMLPSLSSAVYFFVFLGLCTWWSLCKTFDKLLFSCLCVLMAIFSAGHLIILYSNQFQFLQEAISLNDSYTSLFGISSIVRTDCSSTWKLAVNSGLNWHHFVNPIMLLVLYYTLATLIRLWLQDPMFMQESEEEEINEGNETAENSFVHTSIGKRLLWWKAHQKTEERNLISTQDGYSTSEVVVINSNGTSFDYVSAVPIENGPVSLDIYSTPQYKVDQPVEFEEKTDENTNEILDSQLDEEEEKTDAEDEEEEEEEEEQGGPPGTLVKVFKFIMKQSYICALIAMMAWSITYVSWLTFVFLLWSCTLWMVRDRRKYAMMTSPFMVAYGNLLLVLQYIWCFEHLDPVPGFFLKMKVPFTELSTKILCQLSFWLLLRQTLMERQEKMEEEAALCDVQVDEQKKEEEKDKEEEEEEGDENDLMHVIGKLVMALLVKYWIYICGGMFFFVSFEGEIVMYKIVYMMMFLSCVALYQVHYEWWRRILKYFWMSVVVYTMLVLILIYTCQFENAIANWTKMTGIPEEVLKDIGLVRYSLADLFTRIFIPTSFLLVCILHLHYFHDGFLQLTDLKAVISKEQSTIYRLAHPDGSLADLTMMSTSPEPLLKEEKEKESMNEVLVVDCVEEEKKKESLSIHSAHLSSQEDIQQFSAATDPELPSEQSSDLKNKWHLVLDRLTVLFLKFLECFHKLKLFIWWLLEMHIIKIVSTYIIVLALKEVSLLNYVFLISWTFALPYQQFRVRASSVCTIWTCVIIICKLLYQLKSIKHTNYSSNCSMPSNYSKEQEKELYQSLLYKDPIDPANWVGLEKFNENSPELPNLRNNLLMLAILAFEVTIYRHQEFFRLKNKLSPPPSRTIFHDITRQHLDNSIINCAKYFINYFFYKFGLEVCFLMAINVMGQRMDFYSMLHGLALAVVMYRRRRKAIAEIWPKYCCFLACMITFQYLICIGIPPAACKDYPWRFPDSMMDSDVIKWLYLPDFHTQPNSMFLVYDFLLLLCASLQMQVFEDENKAAVRLMAGDNVEICRDLDAASFSVHNPVPDFIHCRSYLDMLKVIMFSYLFWFVLTIIFITGTTRISVFCMGYLVACFYFLLFGGNLLLKPIKKILRYWDFLIAYNVFVITMKNVFAILACGYIKHLVKNSCWLVQLLSLACTIKEYKALEGKERQGKPVDGCEVPRDEAGIIWDSICFTFLLLQRRVFMSYYFLHVVADIRAGQILASRGAELFQASIVKAVRARLEEEKRSMEQLKRQMDRIKTRQQKFKRGKEKMLSMAQESGDEQKLIQPDDNDDDEKKKNKVQKKQWWRPWVDHASMVRSGDYYLFETDSEEEEEEEEKKDEDPPKRSAFQRAIRKFASALVALPRSVIKLPKTVLQYLIRAAKFVYHTWIADSKAALKERGKGRRHFWKRYGRRRRKDKKEGHVAIEIGEEDRQSSEEDKTDGPDNIIKRVFNIIKFTWVLFLTTVESITKWLNSVCREYIDISTVLRIERCMLTREVKKGNVPSRESIHVYYQKQMKLNGSRESGLDRISEEDSCSNRERRRRAGYSLDSFASRDSISSAYTEATMLFSRQSTLDDLDDMPQNIPKTSERARPKLRKMYGLDMSNSSADSGSSVMSSEATQCVTLFSRQGTNDTIDEVEDEPEQVQVKKEETTETVEDKPERADHEEVKEEEVKQEATNELEEEMTQEATGELAEEVTDELVEEVTDELVEEVTDELVEEATQEVTDELVEEVTQEVTGELAEEVTQEVTGELAEEVTRDVEEEVQWDLVDPEEAVEDVQVPQLDCEEHQEEELCVTEDEEGEQPIRQEEGESSGPENVQTDVISGHLFTPDTDAPNTSDADVPPSYSKAVSFDRLSVSSDESDSDKRLMLMTPESRSELDDPLLPSMTTDLTASELLLNKMFYDEELENSERFYKSQPLGLQLCYALYNLLVAHSEMVCYLVIILNHMISASMATLVLPILIFLWAMLSVPRPSKRFWMTAIVYTEVTIVVKYFFQFSFFPFNQNLEVNKGKPYHPPNIIGTEKKEGYVHYDLVQLLALFFHRSILKCHGLWDEDDPKASHKDECLYRDDSLDEGKMAVAIPPEEEKSSSAYSLKSVNLGMSLDSSQVHVQILYPEHRPHLRRQSTSGSHLSRQSTSGSHLSRRSSVHSKHGSTSTRNSIRRENSTLEPEVPQKSRKEMIMEKIREQLIKAKVYVIKKLVEFYQPIRQFFYNLIHPEYNAVSDVYVFMFLADTVDFIIIVFGFWAFGKHQGGADITSSLSEDQVPGPFLVMVLIQFGTMVVDRALYLRKTVMGKVIFQVILVFGIHFWMFFILPGITERRFSQNTIAQLWYFVKCIYFGLSAYQIRCGYPTRILGNFLTKSYSYVNLFLFQGFRLIPFLTELRAVMDWVWTDTTLSLSSWICVEDIYAHIFILKCWRESEKRYPQPRGQKKKKVVKYGMGGMIVMLLICIVWFPLLFMSLIKSVAGVVNTPLDVSVTLTLGGLQPIFTMSAQRNLLKNVSSEEFKKFSKKYSSDADAMQFLESYVHKDLTIAKLEGSSNSLWTISPPSRENLIKMLNNIKETFPLTFTWSIQRDLSLGAKAETAIGKHHIDLDKQMRTDLSLLLNGTRHKGVTIKNIFPRYIRAPSDSNAKPIVQLYPGKDYMNITLSLHKSSNSSAEGVREWWIVNQTEAGPLSVGTARTANASGLELYIISDQVSPPSLGFLAGYGIMGLYMSVVLVIGKFVREFFSGISHTIMFEELPNVNRILKLCTDIFLVRETGELDLEEDLYAKLIFLYRSPETMIKWTREKSE
ncbi:piezo-type mechanosensitive ion channel component 2 isoform X1 [Onychostoma macrolepis]|uniref:piezo-type mechanosensitive ion channel component 2 isoform X1 n=1 Tax=Onychostoma macrolepis TaxID=369639 RepID=UPI00272CBDEC|nr:piezo-type mechanosensitive ion channel component 2 isoform X1 [Onychostoma macrolepis]XP_058619122.1 piezo-type mechanosensitive ion channel component 2 isoform X1 [Onychostoma macrolepis]